MKSISPANLLKKYYAGLIGREDLVKFAKVFWVFHTKNFRSSPQVQSSAYAGSGNMDKNMNQSLLKLIALGLITVSIGCGGSKPKNQNANAVPAAIAASEEASGAAVVDLSKFYWEDIDFTFVRPSLDDLKNVEATISIEVASEKAPAEMTWSLYYTKSYLSPEGSTPIIENQPIAEKTMAWDTTTLARGTYFIFAVLKVQTTMAVRYFGSSIAVEKGGAENRSPFVALTPGLDGIAYKTANVMAIKFLAADPDGQDVLFTIEYSSNEGASWTPIVSALKRDDPAFVEDPITGQLTYNWTIPAGLPVGSGYQLRVVASDGNKSGLGLVTKRFGMINATDISYSSQIRAIVAAKCAPCHTSAPASKNLRLDFFESPQIGATESNGARQVRALVLAKTRKGALLPMPPVTSPQLTEEERDLIELWSFPQGIAGARNVPGSAAPGAVVATNVINNPLAAAAITLPTVVTETIAVPIDWTIDTPVGDTVTYEVLVAKISAPNVWTSLAAGLTVSTYTWNVSRTNFPSLATEPTRLRVVATTDKGRQNIRTASVQDITILAPP
jgi:hypothetical protein